MGLELTTDRYPPITGYYCLLGTNFRGLLLFAVHYPLGQGQGVLLREILYANNKRRMKNGYTCFFIQLNLKCYPSHLLEYKRVHCNKPVTVII